MPPFLSLLKRSWLVWSAERLSDCDAGALVQPTGWVEGVGFSPDVQGVKQEPVVMDYLRELMEGVERLREIDQEKQARMDQERKSCREQRER